MSGDTVWAMAGNADAAADAAPDPVDDDDALMSEAEREREKVARLPQGESPLD